MHHNKIEVKVPHQIKYLLYSLVVPLGQIELTIFFLSELWDFGIHIELFTVVQFLLLFLFDPVVDRSYFGVALNDGHMNEMISSLMILNICLDISHLLLDCCPKQSAWGTDRLLGSAPTYQQPRTFSYCCSASCSLGGRAANISKVSHSLLVCK